MLRSASIWPRPRLSTLLWRPFHSFCRRRECHSADFGNCDSVCCRQPFRVEHEYRHGQLHDGRGTALAGTDFTATSGTLTFAPGVTSQTVPVTILTDSAATTARGFTVVLSTPANATLGTSQATVTINNPVVAVVPAVVIGNLNATRPALTSSKATFVISLTTSTTNTVTVNYTTVSGTAAAGTDFTAASGSLTFLPGVTSQLLQVVLLPNSSVKTANAFTVVLSSPLNATLGPAWERLR